MLHEKEIKKSIKNFSIVLSGWKTSQIREQRGNEDRYIPQKDTETKEPIVKKSSDRPSCLTVE